jgi:hypothetical protein
MPFSQFERRQFPRLQVRPAAEGEQLLLPEPFEVRDVGLGGFAVESPIPFETGQEHPFEFTLPDGRQVTLRAVAVHSMGTSRPTHYVIGFAFIRTASQEPIIAELVNSVLGAHASTFQPAGR